MVNFKFNIHNVLATKGIAISDVQAPVYKGGFNRDEYWAEFFDVNPVNDEWDAIALIFDAARSHYSPKVDRWPGMKITVTLGDDTTMDIDLPVGNTKLKPFNRTQKSVYCWSHTCLATAGVFHQHYRTVKDLQDAGPVGSWNGYSMYCSTLDGWTEAHQKNCTDEFEAWANRNNVKQYPANVKQKVQLAISSYIAKRTTESSALDYKNIIRLMHGDAIEDAEVPRVAALGAVP